MIVTSAISLGSWCRCAYQVRRHYKKACAYPFDWTITPYSSLKMFFEGNYDSRAQFYQFDADRLEVNKFGSLTDDSTQILHHHFFGKHAITEYVSNGRLQKHRFSHSSLFINAKQKSNYLFNRFLHDIDNNNIVYYRWMRRGHPDQEFPSVFYGESTPGLYELIHENTRSKNIRLVHIISNVCEKPDDADDNSPLAKMLNIEPDKYIMMEITERTWKYSNSFQGDAEAWSVMFDEVERMMGLDFSCMK